MRKCKVNLANGFRTGTLVQGVKATRLCTRGMVYETQSEMRTDYTWLLRWVKMCLVADVPGDLNRALAIKLKLDTKRF